MYSPLRPLTVSELMSRTAQIYRENFLLFAGIAALPYLCWLSVRLCVLMGAESFASVFVDGLISGIKFVHSSFPFLPKTLLTRAFTVFAFVVVTLYGILPMLISILASALVTAATSIGVSEVYLDHYTSVAKCFLRLRGKLCRVIYSSLDLGIRSFFGFILFIIPGIYLSGKYGLAVPAATLEDIKGRRACTRSAELTKGYVARALMISVITSMLQYGMTVVLWPVLYGPLAARVVGSTASMIWLHVASWIFLSISTPLVTIALTVAYYDQRVRSEAFDLPNSVALTSEERASSASITA